MDSGELTEWMAFFELEPFGPWAANINTGIVSSLIYGANRPKTAPTMTAYDLALGEFDRPSKEQSFDDMKGTLMLLADSCKDKESV